MCTVGPLHKIGESFFDIIDDLRFIQVCSTSTVKRKHTNTTIIMIMLAFDVNSR